MAAILAEIVQIIDQSAFSFPTGFFFPLTWSYPYFFCPILIQYFGCYHVVDIKSARTYIQRLASVLLPVEQRQRYASEKKPAALKS
jgi:hypothetical protein